MIFIKEKAVKVVLCLQDGKKHISKVAKEADVTYPHLYYLIKILGARGIVRIEKRGKFKYIELTEKGKALLLHLKEVFEFEEGKKQ